MSEELEKLQEQNRYLERLLAEDHNYFSQLKFSLGLGERAGEEELAQAIEDLRLVKALLAELFEVTGTNSREELLSAIRQEKESLQIQKQRVEQIISRLYSLTGGENTEEVTENLGKLEDEIEQLKFLARKTSIEDSVLEFSEWDAELTTLRIWKQKQDLQNKLSDPVEQIHHLDLAHLVYLVQADWADSKQLLKDEWLIPFPQLSELSKEHYNLMALAVWQIAEKRFLAIRERQKQLFNAAMEVILNTLGSQDSHAEKNRKICGALDWVARGVYSNEKLGVITRTEEIPF